MPLLAPSSRTLFRKEFRSAVPFIGLMIFLGLTTLYVFLGSGYPDSLPFSSYHYLGYDPTEDVVGTFLITFFFALTLVVRERDGGTLDFLDALPISRTRIFLVKVATGLSVLCISGVINFVFVIVTSWMSRTSVDPGFYPLAAVTSFALYSAQLYLFLGIGLVLAYFRQFSFLILGLLFSLWLGQDARTADWAAYLDLTALTKFRYRGTSIAVPLDILGVQLLIGTFCYVFAWAAFLFQGDRSARFFSILKRRGVTATLFALALVATLAAAIWGMNHYSNSPTNASGGNSLPGIQGSEDPEITYLSDAVFGNVATSTTETPDFLFQYPPTLDTRARKLIAESDRIHTQVREFLGAEPAGQIFADLSSKSHFAAGLAFWKRVNLNLASTKSSAELNAVFGHELAHVYLFDLSEQRLSDSFFHEGAASYIEHRFFQTPETLTALRRHAAASYAQAKKSGNRLTLETLLDPVTLPASHDAYLVYPLGEMFVDAIVHTYGDESIGKLARSFNDLPDEPLVGTALWRDRLQSQGYDLSRVADRFFDRLETLAFTTEADFIAVLPSLRAELDIDDDSDDLWIIAVPSVPLAKGYEIVCQFRADSEATIADYSDPEFTNEVDGNPCFYPDPALAIGGSIWYQLGIASPHTAHPVYTEWRRLPL